MDEFKAYTFEEMETAMLLMDAWRKLNQAVAENDVIAWLDAMSVIEKHWESDIFNAITDATESLH